MRWARILSDWAYSLKSPESWCWDSTISTSKQKRSLNGFNENWTIKIDQKGAMVSGSRWSSALRPCWKHIGYVEKGKLDFTLSKQVRIVKCANVFLPKTKKVHQRNFTQLQASIWSLRSNMSSSLHPPTHYKCNKPRFLEGPDILYGISIFFQCYEPVRKRWTLPRR
jgi:hypothetical protein